MGERHITVLRKEAVSVLELKDDSIVVDATLGAGGHSEEILTKLGKKGLLIALDVDPTAVEAAERTLKEGEAKRRFVNRNFREIDTVLDEEKIESVDAILADLGWRMEQFDGTAGSRGFSFQNDEPLLMTYGDPEKYPFTARDIINDWSEDSITNVLRGYGEERFAGRIARKIVETREEKEIETSAELVEIVESAVPLFYKRGRINPATRTFQALRIATNDELGILEEFIEKAVSRLSSNGRLAIITFNSLEDRIVKHLFRDFKKEERGTVLTKKPMLPSDQEREENPRARSAKLRVFIKN